MIMMMTSDERGCCSGNWNGQKPFKKGAACSGCDSGKFYCTDNLCDCTYTQARANISCLSISQSKHICIAAYVASESDNYNYNNMLSLSSDVRKLF